MKIYLHLEEELSPMTIVFKVEKSSDVAVHHLVASLCQEHTANFPWERTLKSDVVKVLNAKRKIIDSSTSIAKLNNGDDLFISVCKNQDQHRDPTSVLTEIQKPSESSSAIGKSGKKQPKDSVAHTNDSNDWHATSLLLQNAHSYFQKKDYQNALELYKKVFCLDQRSKQALEGITNIYRSAERYQDAVPFAEKLANLDSDDPYALFTFGEILTEAGDVAKAIKVLPACIQQFQNQHKEDQFIFDAKTALAKALEKAGALGSASQLYCEVAEMSEKEHNESLKGYVRLGLKSGSVSVEDMILILINILARNKQDFVAKELLSKLVRHEGGMDALKGQLNLAWENAPAVVFIADILREFGSLEETSQLLRHALNLQPNNIDVALLLAHVCENMMNYQMGLQVLLDFYKGNKPLTTIKGIDCSPVIEVLDKTIQLLDTESNLPVQLTDFKKMQLIKTETTRFDFTSTELQLMASFFTVVKILYVYGFLNTIPDLVTLLRPLHERQDLHETIIRNEQAYFSCIEEVLKVRAPLGELARNNIYFCGESHTIPVAWQQICVKDKMYTLKPVLVTGLKIWYLRKESTFYPKINFDNAVKAIPRGSTVIFCFGEIDCREGLLKAVARCKYDSLQEAISASINIYIETLSELAWTYWFKILVHPVPPVINETRFIVKKFNKALKTSVKKAARLNFLEFTEDLVDENGDLKEEYKLDGVHLNPEYLTLVEKSLNAYV